MNEGYKQASEISRNLILTFIFGIVIGTVIGWGARSTLVGPTPEAETPEAVVAQQTPPVETPEPASPAPAVETTPEPVITPAAETPPVQDTAPFDADVEGLWPAAHLFTGIQGTKANAETLDWLNEFKPGGVVLGPENVTDALQLGALVLQIKQAVGLGTKITDPPLIVYADDYHAFPRILPVEGDGSDTNQTPDTATAQAQEALKQGVGVFLGPALDIFIPGVSDELVMASSSDTDSGLAYANQLSGAGLIAVARSFPGAGPAVKADDGTWHIPADQMDALATAMQPFKTAIDAGIPGILVGLMAVPGIDTERPNRPAALSPRLLQLLVRQDWKYEGVLIAGDITRHPMTKDLPRDEIALKALFSGCDAVILRDATRADLRTICDTFVRLSKRSDFPVDQIAASRERLKGWLGRLGKPTTSPAPAQVVVAEVTPAPAEAPTAAEVPMVTTPVPVETPPAPGESTPEPAPVSPTVEATPAPVEAPAPAATPEVPETPAPAEEATVAVEAPATAPPAETPPAAPREHTIVKGDSLNALAKQFGLAVSDIRAWNNMESDVIKIGQVIKLEAPAAEGVVPEATPEPAPEVTPEVAPAPTPEATPAPETSTPEEVSAGSVPAEAPPEAPAPAEAEVAVPASTETPVVTQPPNTDKREHTVAAGETLGSIAGMYGVSVTDVQAWNGLDAGETVINAGAALVVYLPVATPEGTPATSEVVGSTPPEAAPAEAPQEEAKPAHVEPAPGTYDIHEVVAGDNLRRIAQRYGTTQQKLMEMNELKSPDLVQLGSKLKVPKQAPAPAETP